METSSAALISFGNCRAAGKYAACHCGPFREKANQPSPQAWLVCNIKNNISLFYTQSKAEGILNRHSRLCRLQKCLLARYMPHQMRTARMRYTGFFMELTSDCPNTAIMATMTPLPSSIVMR